MEFGVGIDLGGGSASAGFASFKYRHAGAAAPSPARRKWFLISLVPALLGAIAFFPGGLLLLALPLLLRFAVPRRLLLGPRYLICGADIVYYGNVERVDVNASAGRLVLLSTGGRRFVLEREKFPTGARKAAKIAANQAAKFAKVSAKLVEKVRQAAAGAEIVGA